MSTTCTTTISSPRPLALGPSRQRVRSQAQMACARSVDRLQWVEPSFYLGPVERGLWRALRDKENDGARPTGPPRTRSASTRLLQLWVRVNHGSNHQQHDF